MDFYADGSLPGELVSSSTTTANYVETGEILLGMYPVYSYTLDIRTNVMSDGYVSPIAQLGTDYWYWSNVTFGTGNAFVYAVCQWNLIQRRAVCFGGAEDWLTLSEYESNVSSKGGTQTIKAFLDAEDTQLGEVYTADIVFTAHHNLSQTTVPVTMVIGLSTDVKDHMAETVTNLYPNPASDLITVTSVPSMTHITVTNYVGQMVYTSKLDKANSVELNTSSYQAGVYLVKIDTENSVVTRRVIISR